MEHWKEGHTVEKVMKTERSGGKSCEVRMVQVIVELGTSQELMGMREALLGHEHTTSYFEHSF